MGSFCREEKKRKQTKHGIKYHSLVKWPQFWSCTVVLAVDYRDPKLWCLVFCFQLICCCLGGDAAAVDANETVDASDDGEVGEERERVSQGANQSQCTCQGWQE